MLSDSLRLNEHQAAAWLTADTMMSVKWLPADAGLLNLFVQHMSCALSINENAEPDVRVDMEDRGRSLLRYMNN
jgi:thiamine phosphate synthase YjbQ (UPF0047 family)